MSANGNTTTACQFCGAGPAVVVTLRRHVGMIVLQQFVRFRGPVCRTHGRQLAKMFLGKTLVEGWWGIISFFANWIAVGTDVVALRRVNRLAPPQVVPVAEPAPAAAAS